MGGLEGQRCRRANGGFRRLHSTRSLLFGSEQHRRSLPSIISQPLLAVIHNEERSRTSSLSLSFMFPQWIPLSFSSSRDTFVLLSGYACSLAFFPRFLFLCRCFTSPTNYSPASFALIFSLPPFLRMSVWLYPLCETHVCLCVWLSTLSLSVCICLDMALHLSFSRLYLFPSVCLYMSLLTSGFSL